MHVIMEKDLQLVLLCDCNLGRLIHGIPFGQVLSALGRRIYLTDFR